MKLLCKIFGHKKKAIAFEEKTGQSIKFGGVICARCKQYLSGHATVIFEISGGAGGGGGSSALVTHSQELPTAPENMQ